MVLIKGEDELSKVELTYGKVALINNDEVIISNYRKHKGKQIRLYSDILLC